jgi:hypothetical protein
MERVDLAQDKDQWRALLNTVMNLRDPYNAGKLLSNCTISGFSRRAKSSTMLVMCLALSDIGQCQKLH